jgi:histidinol-phosphatase (PHP family)
MDGSCRRALELGISAIAFTEHADFDEYVTQRNGLLDVPGYLQAIEQCRSQYPSLRILSGLELGSPHRFPTETAKVLAAGSFDRVLGSVHHVVSDGELVYAGEPELLTPERAGSTMRSYLAEVLRLLESEQPFEILAHVDYPKRYWPHDQVAYREVDYEEEFRSVLAATAHRGAVLEINTTGGEDPERQFCPGPLVVRWWYAAGGTAVSFGSDAHEPVALAAGFGQARQLAEAAGFKRFKTPADFLRR